MWMDVSLNIIIFSISYNEEKILPFFLRYYEKFASRIIIYDNESTDGTLDIFRQHPLVSLRSWSSGDEIRDDLYLQIKNNCWKEYTNSQEIPDWIFIVDMDEFIWNQDLYSVLNFYKETKVAAIYSQGFEMFSQDFIFNDSSSIIDRIRYGVPSEWYCKLNVFNPKALVEIDYGLGAHTAQPKLKNGFSVFSIYQSALKCFHMKYLGWTYFLDKNKTYQKRLSQFNRTNKIALNYDSKEPELRKNWEFITTHPQAVIPTEQATGDYWPVLLMGK